MDVASDPASGSVNKNAPMASPDINLFRYRSRTAKFSIRETSEKFKARTRDLKYTPLDCYDKTNLFLLTRQILFIKGERF